LRNISAHAFGAARRPPAAAVAFLNPCATTLDELGVKATGRFPVRYLVKDGSPADAIAEAVSHHHPCILVAGVKRSSNTRERTNCFCLTCPLRVPVLCVPPEPALANLATSLRAGADPLDHYARADPLRLTRDGRRKKKFRTPSHRCAFHDLSFWERFAGEEFGP